MSRLYRTQEVAPLLDAMGDYLHETKGFYPDAWVSDDDNYAIRDEEGSHALFEYQMEGTYAGHFFFVCRGKKAEALAHAILDKVFNEYRFKTIIGLTPVDNRGARWMSRRIGFTSHGIIDPQGQPCELFILTKDEYERQRV